MQFLRSYLLTVQNGQSFRSAYVMAVWLWETTFLTSALLPLQTACNVHRPAQCSENGATVHSPSHYTEQEATRYRPRGKQLHQNVISSKHVQRKFNYGECGELKT